MLYGGYARGTFRRGDPDKERLYRALIDLTRLGWGKDNPAFRQVFTSRFIPGRDRRTGWLVQRTLSQNNFTRDRGSTARDARDDRRRDLLGKVQAPTLVLHSRDDDVIPIAEGHILAAGIPGAQFVELDSKNHILLETEPAWERFCAEVLEFMDAKSGWRGSGVCVTIAARARSAGADYGRTRQREIAERLSISEKTVRNHVSNLFDKLGVWTRARPWSSRTITASALRPAAIRATSHLNVPHLRHSRM